MLGIERRRQIMDRLNTEKKVHVTDLAKFFNVTEETIRRDLERLEAEDLLHRSYGGAVLNEQTTGALSFARRAAINNDGKNSIAALAAKLISNGTSLMFDASTTSLALLPQLKNKKSLTIITNSARAIAESLDFPHTILSTGGVLKPHALALTGAATSKMLANYFVDFAFISCKGLALKKGVLESNEEEGAIKQIMIKQARQTFLLCDHSKFNAPAFYKICEIKNLAGIITDISPGPEWETYCKENNIKLMY